MKNSLHRILATLSFDRRQLIFYVCNYLITAFVSQILVAFDFGRLAYADDLTLVSVLVTRLQIMMCTCSGPD